MANTAFILHSSLGMTKGTTFAQLSMTGLAFVISGAMHVAGQKVAEPTRNGRSLFGFYCLNGLGIIFEDAIRILYFRLVGNEVKLSVLHRLGRVLGYIWTFLFMSWAISKMYFRNN